MGNLEVHRRLQSQFRWDARGVNFLSLIKSKFNWNTQILSSYNGYAVLVMGAKSQFSQIPDILHIEFLKNV